MPIFKLSAPKMRRFSDYILSRNASNFTRSHLDFKNFTGGETPGPMLKGAGNGGGDEKIKRFIPLKELEGGKGQGRYDRDGRGKVGAGRASGRGESCSKVLGEINAWFALISASVTTYNVSKRKHDFIGSQCCIFITETKLV